MKMTFIPPTPEIRQKSARSILTIPLIVGCVIAGNITSAKAVTLDLSTGNIPGGIINGAVYFVDNASSGTGVFGKEQSGGVFLRLQNTPVETGFNTSANGVMDNKDDSFTDDLLYSTLNEVTIGGEQYVPFLLDINEGGNDSDETVILEDVVILSTPVSGLSFQTIGELKNSPDTTVIYELDGPSGIDFDVKLAGNSSGVSDMGLFIPVSGFAGVQDDEYIILYSHFVNSESGFEEWSLGAGASPDDDPGPVPVFTPEPRTAMLGLLGLLMIVLRRNK